MGGLFKTPKPPGPSAEEKAEMARQREETARLRKENAEMQADSVAEVAQAKRGMIGRKTLVRRYYGLGGGS